MNFQQAMEKMLASLVSLVGPSISYSEKEIALLVWEAAYFERCKASFMDQQEVDMNISSLLADASHCLDGDPTWELISLPSSAAHLEPRLRCGEHHDRGFFRNLEGSNPSTFEWMVLATIEGARIDDELRRSLTESRRQELEGIQRAWFHYAKEKHQLQQRRLQNKFFSGDL